MTAPMTRFTIATPVLSATRTTGGSDYDMAYTDVVLASDYERLEQEFEKLRLDNLSKNGSIKGLGAQIAALQRAVKNRDKLKARAEAERDTLRAQVEAIRSDANLYRQWFNAVQDVRPLYHEPADYQAAIRLLEFLGMRVPSSVSQAALQETPEETQNAN